TVGTFGILAIDGSGNFPLVQGQDCSFTFPVCNPTTTVGNPGYQAIGGQCDHNGSGNCTGGEANSVWYNIKINPLLIGTSTLQFDIVPNDYGNPNPITGAANPGYNGPNDESDYDFVLWKVSGSGATSCAAINSGGVNPAACNYSALGLSGTTNNGDSPAAYPGFNGSYENAPTVVAGEEYILVVQNYTNSTAGFTLQFPPVNPVAFTPPTTVYWSGGAFTNSYTNTSNWGGCNAPSCTVSAFVTAASSNQPILAAGTYAANNLTINAGASLTLQTGAILQICGNFTNNGSLICQPGSTVEFIGIGTQTITGAFENGDAFNHLTINKLLGTVVLANNIDVKGNFITSNNTSILNSAGRQVRVGGNFTNALGNTTFSNTGTTGNLTFNGGGPQAYSQGTTQLDLNFVTINKPAGVLTLSTNMFIKATTGNLTLTNGIITTNGNRVEVANSAPGSVTAGSATSYINGNLYRAIGGTGSYDFPVGTATLYERANVNFTGATTIPQLRARFDPWAGAPNTLGLPDCFNTATYNIPSQNMGIWTITASANPTSGTYDITLYSTGATNTAGAVGWTVQKAANASSAWGVNGTCAFSTVSVIRRTGLSGFSVFGVGQSTTPLPVELINFQGYREGTINFLQWTTASEINSDYFDIERSRNGKDFESIETIQAQGNSNTPVQYKTSDPGQTNSINYYRLKFVDLDGSFDYSKIISLTSEISSDLDISKVYPNPVWDELFFNYSVSRLTKVDITVLDNSGRIVWSKQESIEGNGVYSIETFNFSIGNYMLIVKSDDGSQKTYRWVKY
ncbi:MAG: T9SS type A sorting domain-containing protein, partial [Bacteroidota bacterium]